MPDAKPTGDPDPRPVAHRPGRFRSPWLEQLAPAAALRPLRGQVHATDLVIVGAGIAGLATAYFCLRDTASGVTLLERTRAVLLYNLGCNGVGFLPSIAGGRRIARLLCNERLPPSLFDPA